MFIPYLIVLAPKLTAQFTIAEHCWQNTEYSMQPSFRTSEGSHVKSALIQYHSGIELRKCSVLRTAGASNEMSEVGASPLLPGQSGSSHEMGKVAGQRLPAHFSYPVHPARSISAPPPHAIIAQ